MVHKAIKAASILEKQGIDVDIIDLRSLVPLDTAAILKSVKKTGKVVIAQEAYRTSGFAGEISAIISEEAFTSLKGPVIRITGPDTTIPFSPVLEDEFIPSPEKIVNAVLKLVKG
jgi:pyruvate/2-oxoglutarate/acetoin dehydrogenase E1 component